MDYVPSNLRYGKIGESSFLGDNLMSLNTLLFGIEQALSGSSLIDPYLFGMFNDLFFSMLTVSDANFILPLLPSPATLS